MTFPPFGPYNAPFSSTRAVDAAFAALDVGAAANAICGIDEKTLPLKCDVTASFTNLFDVADVAAVVAVAAAAAAAVATATAAAVTDAVDADDDVHDVDNDLILFNFFKPQFGRFTLLSLFIGSLATWHLLQHFVEWTALADD